MKHYLQLLIIFGFFFSLESLAQPTGNNIKILDLTNNSHSSGSSFFANIGSQMQVDTFYTFECWMYVDNKVSGDFPQIMDRRTVFSLFLIGLDASSSGGDYRVRFVARDNSDNIIASIRSSGKNTGSTDYQTDFHTWYHVAVSRDATTARLFINGTLVDQSTDNDFILSTPSGKPVNFAAKYDIDSGYYFFNDAAFDEFRYSDIARYTSSFPMSVYSAPHDTTGDPHTILLFNFDKSDFSNTTSANSYTALYHGTPLFMDWDDASLSQYLPLPIKYIEPLSVKKYGENKAILYWATATEENNDGFEIECSTNAVDWKSIGFVKGNGNSIMPCYYSFIDAKPNTQNYYRLKQMDYNGKYEYSNIVYYSFVNDSKYVIYPNPSSNKIHIIGLSPNKKASAVIYNVEGEFVKASPSPEIIDIKELPNGIYFVEIRQFNSQRKIIKFIKN